MELIDADTLLSELGCLDNRLSLSVIIAAMLIGLGILIATTAQGSEPDVVLV